ncbi:competence protein ComGC [Breznakia sp. PF5-3]|uniref:hypothetical protein n=1 Tax=unclassified Breznakia TaxID=2623764 RepID=UPI0024064722|nr:MULTISPECIES: hypothetical protein [unclassified Breznakia]MDF9824380.1 competence protein ComGC [Breznakia sp. PM6-1]MDF9835109.1 competence protein ComGC [Breznakia sp. PF5-3]MDF9838911.1 competence protein ComGC [Breznakia sp. PFB2-8]MDF9860941.1 competence protein ComGC [Breznakia sp. PH5-24]
MHLNRKGFTLFQMLMVLLIISICLLLQPKTQRTKTSLKYETMKLREWILQAQEKAIFDKTNVSMMIEDNMISSNNKTYSLAKETTCGSHHISFNHRGNTNQARTIECRQGKEKAEIVINLGAGNIYVR